MTQDLLEQSSRKILSCIKGILEDVPCEDPCVISLMDHPNALTDYMIVVGGTSSPHVRAIAQRVAIGMKKQGTPPLCIEGLDKGEHKWVVVDFGMMIVHIMQKEERDFYRLEDLWNRSFSNNQKEEEEQKLQENQVHQANSLADIAKEA